MSSLKRKVEDTDLPADGGKPAKQQKVDPQKQDSESKSIKSESNSGIAEQQKEHQPNPNLSKIQSQLEFYWSDGNLPTDDHILSTTKENNGYYPLLKVLTFRKIQELTTSRLDLIAAVEQSSKIELNADKSGIRRHSTMPPLPTKKDMVNRSIFAKGFHPRMTVQQIETFWKSRVPDDSDILSVFLQRERVTTGIMSKSQSKQVRRFMGECKVCFSTQELMDKMSKMVFECEGRTIRCGKLVERHSVHQWTVKDQTLPFESQRVLYIRDIPIHCTHCDIRTWIKSLFRKNNRGMEAMKYPNRLEYVHKEMNSGIAYVRISTESNAEEVVDRMRRRPFMGCSAPRITILEDDDAKKVWDLVAVDKGVHISVTKKEAKKEEKGMKVEENENGVNGQDEEKKDETTDGKEEEDIAMKNEVKKEENTQSEDAVVN